MIVPGYIIGLSCLFIISYRTLIAFFSESKAVTIYINKFDEQFIDLFALVIIWVICLVGLIILSRMLKEEKTPKNFHYKPDKKPLMVQDHALFGIDNTVDHVIDKRKTMGVIAESSTDIDHELNLND